MLIIKPLAWLFRCLSIAPTLSPADKYFFLVTMIVVTPISVYGLMEASSEPDPLVRVLLVCGRSGSLIGGIGFLVYNFLHRESYPSILRDLRRVVDDLRAAGVNPLPTHTMQLLCLFTISFVTLSKALVSLVNNDSYHVIYEAVLALTITPMLIQHLILVSQLDSLFSALNDQLRGLSAAADDTAVDVVSAQLESVFRVHTSLHVIVSRVNGHYFIYNFMSTASRLFYCIGVMYNYLTYIAGNKPSFNIVFFYIFFLKTVSFVIQCVVCHACAKEANYSVLLAHYTLQPHTPHRLWKEVGDFSSLYIHNKVHFSVGNVFTLNRPLITRFSVLALSYLIVAVQLKDAHVFDADNNASTTMSTTDSAANVTNYANFTTNYDYIF